MGNTWQLQEAKAKFSQVVERTLTQGAQFITRRGKKAVVLLPYEEYQQIIERKDSLARFLLDSPLAGCEVDIQRQADLPRDIRIEP